MNFRSIASLNQDIVRWTDRLSLEFDVIVGVPRSGLLAANLLALHLNLPLTDVDGLIAGRLLVGGERCKSREENPLANEACRVLIVDDSVYSGKQMDLVRASLDNANLPFPLKFGAVYIAPGKEHTVDCYADIVEMPRVFEWNVLNHPGITHFCVDIDGVLCPDPTPEENDDGPRYRDFIANTKPRVIPRYEIGWLVTSRLEKYRELTENWLKQHNIQFKNLVMLDLPSKEARIAAGCHGSFKAGIYRDTNAPLFIESEIGQAYEIARTTGKPVLCMDTKEMIHHVPETNSSSRLKRIVKLSLTDPKQALQKIRSRIIG